MFPASGSPRSMKRLTSLPSSSTATRVSNASLFAMISLLMPSHLDIASGGPAPLPELHRGHRLEQNLLPPHPDVDEQAGCGKHDDERASAVTDERKRDAGDRHQPDGHADVDEDVKPDHGEDADGHEHAQPVLRLRGDGPGPPQPEAEQHEHEDRPGEPQFLSDHGEDEIGVLLRDEVEEVLGAVEQPFAEDLPGTDGDLGFDELVAGARRVNARIEEDDE